MTRSRSGAFTDHFWCIQQGPRRGDADGIFPDEYEALNPAFPGWYRILRCNGSGWRTSARSPEAAAFPRLSRDLICCQASVELVRTLLPTVRDIRLLGVTVSNFDEPPAGVANELPLFASEAAIAHPSDTVTAVPVTGGL